MTTEAQTADPIMTFEPLGPGRWRLNADPKWCNPGGGLWGGYDIGVAIGVLKEEPTAAGEALSLTLTYAYALPPGDLVIRTRCLRQGGSIGVWEVELCSGPDEAVGVHAIVTMARRPETPAFQFAKMPDYADPESLPTPPGFGNTPTRDHMAGTAFERRGMEHTFPPKASGDAYTLCWVRSKRWPLDKITLGMITDNMPPRSMFALGGGIMTTTLSLTVYLHATEAELAAIGHDYILVECDGRVGQGGASDERSSYWSRDGKLLATSEQLAWYRQRRPDPAK
ncbi:MAG: thioesterase family protein [Caulobacteraceae bacterium]